jgi:hypothetical protein
MTEHLPTRMEHRTVPFWQILGQAVEKIGEKHASLFCYVAVATRPSYRGLAPKGGAELIELL